MPLVHIANLHRSIQQHYLRTDILKLEAKAFLYLYCNVIDFEQTSHVIFSPLYIDMNMLFFAEQNKVSTAVVYLHRRFSEKNVEMTVKNQMTEINCDKVILRIS